MFIIEKQITLRIVAKSGWFEIRFEETKSLLKSATWYTWSVTRVRETKEN